jgi:hypothetical protein
MKLHKEILHELKEHIPFTVAATLTSIILIFFIVKLNLISSFIPLFYIFHPAHVLFSAAVSSAMFYNYNKKIFPSILIGVIVSVAIGSLSDIFFPYLGTSLIGIPISFHLPALEIPVVIFGMGLIGAGLGVMIKKTKFPHFLHVLISVFASLFYVFAYSTNFLVINFLFILLIVSISVVIPCCLGDIVLPLLLRLKKIGHEQKKTGASSQ